MTGGVAESIRALLVMSHITAFLAGGAAVLLILHFIAKDMGPEVEGDQISKGHSE